MEFKNNYLIDDDAYNRYTIAKRREEVRKLKEEWMFKMSQIEGINQCSSGDASNCPPLPADIGWTGTGDSMIGIFNYNDIFFRIYADVDNNIYKWESLCNNIQCHRIRYTTNFKCCNK